jgi:hypothetical protein
VKIIGFILEKAGKLKTHCRQFFWAWIKYQAVKGVLTTAFIWLPLIYAFT